MKPGTPGFVGARLREAREARGLTAIALAEILGVTRQSVSQYESGEVTPGPDVMHRILSTLGFPPSFYWRPANETSGVPVFFRSRSAATKLARARATPRLEWLHEVVAYLSEFLELPEVNVPACHMPSDPVAISSEEIEDSAVHVRRFWGLGNGPISNVTWLLEKHGSIIGRCELAAETLDALSRYSAVEGRPYILLGTDKASAVRSRFDASHELGHFILHRNIPAERLNHPVVFRQTEEQAHRFAAAFLLPAEAFATDFYVPTLDALRSLKAKWLVSIGMMIHRAEDLNLISSDQARRLWISHTRRGWNRREPLDDELPVEQPRTLRRAFELLVNEGIQSRAEIATRLPFPADDIEDLACLDPGFLDDMPPAVRLLPTARLRKRTGMPQSHKSGDVVLFPHDQHE